MKIWPFHKSRSWSGLSTTERHTAAGKIAAAAMNLVRRAETFGKGYEAVITPYKQHRRPTYIERDGEDKQLSAANRHRLVNMHRDMMRNSPTRVAQDQQIRVNVVGACGGKLYAAFPPEYRAAADEVANYFNRVWFPRAEFTFRKNFNWLLKTCLTAQDTNGNVILVFDDGILTGGNGTGRIRGFEGDEISAVQDDDFARLFPSDHSQRAGFVYNGSGMFCGAFVSTSGRGHDTFAPGSFLTLRLDPFDDETVPNWIALGDMRRFNQGRAVSPLTAAITCLVDLHEISASEAQAAKLNAKMVGQILQAAGADDTTPTAFDDFEDDDDAVPSDPTNSSSSSSSSFQTFTTKELNAIGAHFDQMPEGLKIEMLDTKRPNPNMPAYIEFLTGVVGGTRGLARVYSTLKAQTSYTAYRGEQVMTEASFEEARQDLEREVCDWAARCVIARAVKLGHITSALPDNWQRMIAWNWPKMREVSEKDAQSALAQKLSNGVTSLQRELSPGEFEAIMNERIAEKRMFDEAGLIYPGEATASGTIKDEPSAATKDDSTKGDTTDEQ